MNLKEKAQKVNEERYEQAKIMAIAEYLDLIKRSEDDIKKYNEMIQKIEGGYIPTYGDKVMCDRPRT